MNEFAEEKKKGKGGCIIWLIIGILLIGLVLYGGKELKKMQEGDPEMRTPALTAKKYAGMVKSVQAGNINPGVKGVLDCCVKDDGKWFFDQTDNIYEVRQADAARSVGYVATGPMERSMAAIINLVAGSPTREDILIDKETYINDKHVILDIKQGTASPGRFMNYKMELKKEGASWKVSGFCGARAQLEKEIAALNR